MYDKLSLINKKLYKSMDLNQQFHHIKLLKEVYTSY